MTTPRSRLSCIRSTGSTLAGRNMRAFLGLVGSAIAPAPTRATSNRDPRSPPRCFSRVGSPVTKKAGEEQDEPKGVGPGLWPALKAAASDWSAHKSAKAGAAIAYYSIFSLGPLIVVIISIAALIFGRSEEHTS